MKSEIVFEDKHFELTCYTGTLIDSNQLSSTHISGTTGEFGSIHSQTVARTDFFLMDDDGNERSFKTYNWDFSMRPGHKISVYALFSRSTNTGDYVLLKNHNLNDVSPNFLNLRSVIRKKFKRPMLLSLAFFFLGLPLIADLLLPDFLKKITLAFSFIMFVITYPIYRFKCHAVFKTFKEALLKQS